MKHKITFEQLRQVLLDLGYSPDAANGKQMVFRHPESELYIVLPRMRPNAVMRPVDLLSVQNTLANSGMVPKEKFYSLFEMEPIDLWRAIVDAEAEYESRHGRRPDVLKLPVNQAYDLAKLDREEFGPLAEQVLQDGIKVFERNGLLGVRVKLVPGEGQFVFE